jgi:hypothetical protein
LGIVTTSSETAFNHPAETVYDFVTSARSSTARASRSSWSAPKCSAPDRTDNRGPWPAPAAGGYSTSTPKSWSAPGAPPLRPLSEAKSRDLAKDWDRNYVHSLDWRWLTEPLNDGPGESWITPTVDLVKGETMSPLERLFAVADDANGIGTTLGALFDEHGAVGGIQQSVLVRRRPC